MTYKYYEDPSNLPCFKMCGSCFRCQDKGRYGKCNSCSGRYDPELKRYPYDFRDRCRCEEGILQYRTKEGHFIVTPFASNPYESEVKNDPETADERDWRQYVHEQREKRDDEKYDPVTLEDGTSTLDMIEKARDAENKAYDPDG